AHRCTCYPVLYAVLRQVCSCLHSQPPATSKTYTLSLHDALPISTATRKKKRRTSTRATIVACCSPCRQLWRQSQHATIVARVDRSEEHTSELQSHLNLVCRLLLEKKKSTRRCQYE